MQVRRILVSAATIAAAGLIALAPAALADDSGSRAQPQTTPTVTTKPAVTPPAPSRVTDEKSKKEFDAKQREKTLVTPTPSPAKPGEKRSGDQVGEKPAGAPETGGGGTAETSNTGTVLMASGGAVLAAGGGAGILLMRRRRAAAQG